MVSDLDKILDKYDIREIHYIDPDRDPRVQLDKRIAAQIPELERCQRCEGTGNEFLFMYRECSACGGTGKAS